MASQLTLSGDSMENTKTTQRSYTSVVAHYRDNTLYATSKHFGLNTKTILRWAADQDKIRKSKKGSKHVKPQRKAVYPDMEEVLYQEHRRKGLKVKGYWFKARARQLMSEMHPDAPFCVSEGWFTGFKVRHSISFRRSINTAQRPPADKMDLIRQFHREIRKTAAVGEGDEQQSVGRFKLSQIANMDQTPLPFSFCEGPTYADTGEKTVWVRGGASGMEKRQCTVQLTIFADGEPRVKPLIIFKGKGPRIPFREKVKYRFSIVELKN